MINDCLVHNRVSYPDLEAAERERMWEARRAKERERSASLPSGDISVRPVRGNNRNLSPLTIQIIEELFVNKKMKSKLTQANIDPFSSEGRSEIYCRFVLEHPHHMVSSRRPALLSLTD